MRIPDITAITTKTHMKHSFRKEIIFLPIKLHYSNGMTLLKSFLKKKNGYI